MLTTIETYKSHRITRNDKGVYHVWTDEEIVFFTGSLEGARSYIDAGLADLNPWRK